MRSTRFWVLLAAGVMAALLAAVLLAPRLGGEGKVLNVYQDGVCVYSADLSRVDEAYTIEIEGPAGGNTVEVAPGRVRVSQAGCPDHICVEQGWIEDGALPIICLPNRLVVRIEGAAPAGIDGVTG